MNHLQEIEDFEVLSKECNDGSSASTLFENYKHFKKAIKKVPLKVLQQQGWLDSYDDKQSLSELFSNSLDSKNHLFRKNSQANEQLISLWLSKLSSEVRKLFANKDIPLFNRITKTELQEIAQLSQDEDIIFALPDILLSKGIILVYQQSLPGMNLDGIVYTLDSGNPVIGMSFKYPRLDYFWFTLMHELAHINLHIDQLENPILDDFDNMRDQQEQDIEIQANRLAKNSFVSRPLWRNCPPKYSNDENDIIKFAAEINIHPAIIAGMLQKEKNDYRLFRSLIDNLNVRDMVFSDE